MQQAVSDVKRKCNKMRKARECQKREREEGPKNITERADEMEPKQRTEAKIRKKRSKANASRSE
jgi:hypothetical protein